MERFGEAAQAIINVLHTERLDYYSEYIPLINAANQLADYESTGLTPAEVAELAKAKADGRVVVLPCKVGDTVYQLRSKRHAHGKGISPRIVSCIEIYTDGDYALSHQGMTDCIKKELGKTWFLAREEAEAALRKEQNHER